MADGWHRGIMRAGDTETDAKDPEDARLVTCTLVRVDADGARHREWVARPERDIPDEAAKVHGYTTERARLAGRERGEVLAEIENWLTRWWTPDAPMIFFNAPYDLTVLDREFRRELGRGIEVTGPVLDPLVLDRKVDKYRKGLRTLTVVAAHYGVELSESDAHSSLADTFAAGRVLTALVDRYSWLRRMTPQAVHDAQVGWCRESAEGLLAYWRRNPERHPDWRDSGEVPPPEVVDGWTVSAEWPVRAFVSETAGAP